MAWPFKRQNRSLISISDPILAEWFGVGGGNHAGVILGESSTLGLSAVYRAVSLISGTIAGLPMRTLRDVDTTRVRMSSFLDDPAKPLDGGPTSFEWLETVLLHLLLHGNAFLAHIHSQGGALIGLIPIHPLAVSIDHRNDQTQRLLTYRVSLDDGTQKTFTTETMTHIPGMSIDGIRGLSPISIARNSLGTAVAGDRAAARMFSNGALHAGIVTSEEDITEVEAKAIKESLNKKVSGWENAGDIAVINRKLKFTPWTMSLEDAQFLQSRQFQIEEIARWYGIPPHLLMQTEKQTSWGTGVSEQNRGLARYTLSPWTSRIEQRLSRLLPAPRFVEFDYVSLLKPDPEKEIDLLIREVQAGLITVNEARRIRNMDPIPGGDELRLPGSNPGSTSTPVDPEPAGAIA